jgi:hypothetical protein
VSFCSPLLEELPISGWPTEARFWFEWEQLAHFFMFLTTAPNKKGYRFAKLRQREMIQLTIPTAFAVAKIFSVCRQKLPVIPTNQPYIRNKYKTQMSGSTRAVTNTD